MSLILFNNANIHGTKPKFRGNFYFTMSSSQPFLASSPISPARGRRRKSRFTYKHLAQLGLSSTACPLRVIAHIDLDAFYAQCEGVRLNIPEDQPLAVQVNTRMVLEARADTVLAMARPYSNQLSCPQVRSEQIYNYHRGQKAVSGIDHAACGYVEGGG